MLIEDKIEQLANPCDEEDWHNDNACATGPESTRHSNLMLDKAHRIRTMLCYLNLK